MNTNSSKEINIKQLTENRKIAMSKPRIIAFYLPQFYPTEENDKWWGKGFTEWTNVGRAKPLFKGHYQPRVPADLGYYDLRIPEVREQQAELAREAGIEGFCYWHYWFNGRRLLDRIFKEMVENGKPDFPFCLCWANHSWYQKTWDPNKPNKLLIEQTYPGINDYIAHFNALLPAFKDPRYMKVNGKLIFCLYAPLDIPNVNFFIKTWNQLAIEHGLNGFHFIGFNFGIQKVNTILELGFNSVTIDCIFDAYKFKTSSTSHFIKKIKRKILNTPRLLEYNQYIDCMLNEYQVKNNIHPCILPNFDHSPRSAHRGCIIVGNTPDKWKGLCTNIIKKIQIRPQEENLLFIKAWNEWGEGNYLEPDIKYGKKYLVALKQAVDSII